MGRSAEGKLRLSPAGSERYKCRMQRTCVEPEPKLDAVLLRPFHSVQSISTGVLMTGPKSDLEVNQFPDPVGTRPSLFIYLLTNHIYSLFSLHSHVFQFSLPSSTPRILGSKMYRMSERHRGNTGPRVCVVFILVCRILK